ncbi:MAG TPA: hypothetical protein PLQ93_05760 [Bacteroidia bacterium]|nr:hypothetical protein [Bacteroidia bacterium]
MNAEHKNSHILIGKLDEFIRKYYRNQLIKGALYAAAIVLLTFLTVNLLEYFGEFSSPVRAVLFFGFLAALLLVTVIYIVSPLLHLYRIGSVISYEQAARIIGDHFFAIQDRLLNVLQLQKELNKNTRNELLLAGIDQKIELLKPIPFTRAVDLSENKKYLMVVFPLVAILCAIYLIWPQVITRSSERILHYQNFYEKDLPFRFSILNRSLETIQTKDFTLNLEMQGGTIPDEVHILVDGIEYKMEKTGLGSFSHVFSNPQQDISFNFEAAGYQSSPYLLKVLPKPTLLHFDLNLQYPAYLKRTAEQVQNSGDIQVPQGTRITWLFNTQNTDDLFLRFGDSLVHPLNVREGSFSYSRRFMQNNHYSIKPVNKLVLGLSDSMTYNIQVIPDRYPEIEADVKPDSLDPSKLYISGQINDDYGFTKLAFHARVFNTDSAGQIKEKEIREDIHINPDKLSQSYFHFLDLETIQLGPGDRIEYYFEVFDNDGVNGVKSTRTKLLQFNAPTRDDISKTTEKNNSEIKKDLEESIKKSRQLQKDINELSKKINDKKQLGYEEKKKLEELVKKQNDLQKQIEQLKQQNEQNNKFQNQFSPEDQSLAEKQQELEKLFDDVMTPEMKKLFDELNKMLEKFDKNQVQEKLEELKLSNKDIEKELDRNLELFKQLEVEQKMQEAIDKLEELQKKEDQLNRDTEGRKEETKATNPKDTKQKEEKESSAKDQKQSEADKKHDTKETLQNKQDAIQKEFEQLKKDLKDLEKKNQALEEPNTMPNQDEKKEEVSQDMQNSSQELSKNNKKSASRSQKSASQKMQEMKEELQKSMEDAEESQNEENAQALRQILENLLNLSFAQEELMTLLPKTRVDNPQYVQIPKQQNKLKDDSRIIEDSLLALSKRAPQVSATINREISAINQNMDKTVKALAERNTGESQMRMQGTMTSVNNLALLLNESLEQMQNQMKQQMQSKSQKSGKCKKPGSGSGKNPSSQGQPAQNMRKMQEQLNKQLQEMKEALEKGQKPGEKPGDKKGQKPGEGLGQNGRAGNGMPGSAEQFARMAAQQEALRRQMQALMDQMKNKGSKPGGDVTSLMEQTEKELVNKQLTNETLKRQQDILTRLLESEKAEREREQDEQRKSNEAKSQNYSNPEQFQEYKRLKEKEMELLNTVPPGLTPYYKEKVNLYFNSLSK